MPPLPSRSRRPSSNGSATLPSRFLLRSSSKAGEDCNSITSRPSNNALADFQARGAIGILPEGWRGIQLDYQFAKPFPAVEQRFADFHPLGAIGILPEGWRGIQLIEYHFKQPFPAAQYRREGRLFCRRGVGKGSRLRGSKSAAEVGRLSPLVGGAQARRAK